MIRNNYVLELRINGRTLTEYYKNGRCFVQANEGSEYTLRFKNNSWKRVMAVFSVDGVEVLKGKKASLAENGYIVEPFSHIDIFGYRIDDKTVAAFKFSRGGQSYAVIVGGETNELEGDPALGVFKHDKTDRNNGVIGVRVFEEDVADKDYASTYKKCEPLPVTTFSANGALNSSITWNGAQNFCASGYSPSAFTVHTTGCAGQLRAVYSGASFGGTTSSLPRATYNSVTFNAGMSLVSNGFVDLVGEGPVMGMSASSSSGPAPVNIYNLSCTGVHYGVAVANGGTSAGSLAPDFDLGSTWGQKVEDKVKEVSFKRVAAHTDIEIFYASRASLEAFGIDFSNTKQIFSWPSAFEDRKKYCKAPPGWTGEQKGGAK